MSRSNNANGDANVDAGATEGAWTSRLTRVSYDDCYHRTMGTLQHGKVEALLDQD